MKAQWFYVEWLVKLSKFGYRFKDNKMSGLIFSTSTKCAKYREFWKGNGTNRMTHAYLLWNFLFCIRNKLAVSLVGSTLQNQDSMVLSLLKKLVLCFTSLGRSIITRTRERNFEGLLKINNIVCGVFLRLGFYTSANIRFLWLIETKEELRLLLIISV